MGAPLWVSALLPLGVLFSPSAVTSATKAPASDCHLTGRCPCLFCSCLFSQLVVTLSLLFSFQAVWIRGTSSLHILFKCPQNQTWVISLGGKIRGLGTLPTKSSQLCCLCPHSKFKTLAHFSPSFSETPPACCWPQHQCLSLIVLGFSFLEWGAALPIQCCQVCEPQYPFPPLQGMHLRLPEHRISTSS